MDEFAAVYNFDDIDDLLDRLTKPFYVLRMARADVNVRMVKSSISAAANAKREIREILNEYAATAASKTA